ncbi:MAG: acetoin utilization protein AcuC [Promethearchaeota archaeon]
MTKKVGLIYSNDYLTYNFGSYHPLRPIRLELTYALMKDMGLLDNPKLEIFKPEMALKEELLLVHNKEYVDVVKELSDNPKILREKYPHGIFGLGTQDDPVFKGMYEVSSLVVGGSIKAAELVMDESNEIDHSFNFGGGLHHANRKQASGFCIFNDVAIAIQKIRIRYPEKKIMYIDIDAHHGDGVQWIFYDDPHVLTLSLHQDGKTLFPGTGFLEENGEGEGKYTAINFPLYPGTYDEIYLDLFEDLVPKIIEAYKPDVLVTQLGVDTHFNDPLTMLNLTTTTYERLCKDIHEYAHKYTQGKWIALGGGGYLMCVVPRAWTMALGIMLEQPVPNEIPATWSKLCSEKIDDEEIPALMRDHNPRLELQLLKDPVFPVRIEKRSDEIKEYVKNNILPNLEKLNI